MADGQINLVVIRAADIERSAQFYRLLGLDFTKHRHGKGVEHYASETGSVAFEIYPRQNEDAGLPSLRIGFQVASVDEAVTALQGAEPSSSPRPKTHPALSYRNGTRERLLINDANEASYLEVNLDEN